jgi:hypothetical protein
MQQSEANVIVSSKGSNLVVSRDGALFGIFFCAVLLRRLVLRICPFCMLHLIVAHRRRKKTCSSLRVNALLC